MPEIADVVSSETATSEWANDIRDRTIQRYTDLAERTADHSSPEAGDLSYLASTGDLDVYHSGAWRHIGAPVGKVDMLAGGSVPIGWLLCNGQAVSRTTYAALFAQIGETWGDGDGSTTFNVPDFRGRVPRGVAASGTGDAVGETFGADTHTHTGPSHSHSNPNTSTTGSHSHTQTTHDHSNPNTAVASGTAEFGAGSGFLAASASHVHAQGATGSGGGGSTSSAGSHAHSQGNTGAGGTGSTGSASTIQAGAAINFIIKT